MMKIWKGKSTDLYLAVLYFVLYSIGIHVIVAIRHSIKYDSDILHAIKNPLNFLLTFGLLFFFMSPVWVYFRKVPKMLRIDVNNQKLEIQKRSKTLNYNMDKIRYYKRNTTFFYILEIHATFETSRNGQIEKLATSIIVPNWGLSWNKNTMNEIINEFNNMNIEEIKNRPQVPIHEYFYN